MGGSIAFSGSSFVTLFRVDRTEGDGSIFVSSYQRQRTGTTIEVAKFFY